MGTRADLYVGIGKDMEWIGSIAWDGYPEGIPEAVKEARDEVTFRHMVGEFLSNSDRDDATLPEDGWPWPWKDSCMTDFAYTFDGEKVLCSCFGSPWQVAMEYKDTEDFGKVEFPDMTNMQRVALGRRSGLIVVHVYTDGSIEIERKEKVSKSFHRTLKSPYLTSLQASWYNIDV